MVGFDVLWEGLSWRWTDNWCRHVERGTTDDDRWLIGFRMQKPYVWHAPSPSSSACSAKIHVGDGLHLLRSEVFFLWVSVKQFKIQAEILQVWLESNSNYFSGAQCLGDWAWGQEETEVAWSIPSGHLPPGLPHQDGWAVWGVLASGPVRLSPYTHFKTTVVQSKFTLCIVIFILLFNVNNFFIYEWKSKILCLRARCYQPKQKISALPF